MADLVEKKIGPVPVAIAAPVGAAALYLLYRHFKGGGSAASATLPTGSTDPNALTTTDTTGAGAPGAAPGFDLTGLQDAITSAISGAMGGTSGGAFGGVPDPTSGATFVFPAPTGSTADTTPPITGTSGTSPAQQGANPGANGAIVGPNLGAIDTTLGNTPGIVGGPTSGPSFGSGIGTGAVGGMNFGSPTPTKTVAPFASSGAAIAHAFDSAAGVFSSITSQVTPQKNGTTVTHVVAPSAPYVPQVRAGGKKQLGF